MVLVIINLQKMITTATPTKIEVVNGEDDDEDGDEDSVWDVDDVDTDKSLVISPLGRTPPTALGTAGTGALIWGTCWKWH